MPVCRMGAGILDSGPCTCMAGIVSHVSQADFELPVVIGTKPGPHAYKASIY